MQEWRERHHRIIHDVSAQRDADRAWRRQSRHYRLVGAVHGQLPNNVDHRFRRIVVERQVMAAGHNLPKRVYCYGSDMGGVDFHADERARIGDDAQSGLRTAATFRIFFLD